MEVTILLCNSSVCRLCGEENKNTNDLFVTEENKQNLSDLINRYLPLKVSEDGKYPKVICPGCYIQLEATKLFFDLIIEGQSKLRELYVKQQETLKRQEKQRQQLENALKLVSPSSTIGAYSIQEDAEGEKILIQIVSDGPLFSTDHELTLKVEGLEKPKRKRGRPPKQNSETLDDNKENTSKVDVENEIEEEVEYDGDARRKRRIKVPTRFQEALQGKEMDRIFKEEGVIDEDSFSENEELLESETDKGINEIIGHMEGKDGEDLGELVVRNKNTNKIKLRPKNSLVSSKRKKRYECDICSRMFSHPGRLEVHKSFHRNENYMCGTEGCDEQAKSQIEIENHHKETGHSGYSIIELLGSELSKISEINRAETSAQSTSKEHIVRSIVKVPNEKEINEKDHRQEQTEVTEKEDKITVLYKQNRTTEKDKEKPDCKTICKICDKTFSCKQNYEVHYKAIHENQKPFKCEKCNKTFPYLSSYKCHMQQHSEKVYPCESCQKVFNHPSSLVYHREAEHNNGRRFVCSKCKKTFKHKQLLLRHQLVHSNVRPYDCKYCAASFKTRANLLNHMPMHTGERKYFCNICSQSFAHKTSLTLHMRWHNGSKPYECDVCLKSFSQKGNLAEHKRIHTGEKPFTCTHCDRKFTTSSQYKNHVKRHTGERPWQCEYCSKTFLNKDTWKSHTRRHSDERPFQCGQCMRAFPEQWALKKHQRLHTGEKPYVCEYCSKSFADSSNLAKHKKIHLNKLNQQEKTNNSGNIKIVTSEEGEKILYLTYDDGNSNEETQTVVHIMDTIEPISTVVNQDEQSVNTATLSPEVISEDTSDDITIENSLQLQQVIDNDGNPLSITAETGENIKIVMSVEDGQQTIQGLMSNGNLVPINLIMHEGKLITAEVISTDEEKIEKVDEETVEAVKTLVNPTVEQLLDNNIQFLTEDGQKLNDNIQLLTEDGQNFCFITTYPSNTLVDESINPEYLTIT